MNPIFYFVVGYLAIISALSIYYMKLVKTEEDFTVAGRRLPAWILAGTLMATWMGSGTVVGGTNSLAYNYGPWVAIIFGLASPVGILVLYFLAGKIRELAQRTIPDILEMRYGSAARIIGTLIIMLAYVGIVSYQFKGVGFVLNATLGIPINQGTTIAAVIIILVATLGGLISVAYTDFLSAIIMLIGLGIGIPIAIHLAGGWGTIAANLPPEHLKLGGLTAMGILGYFLPLFLLILGDQNMYQRFFAAKDPKEAKAGVIGWLLGVLIVTPLVAFGATASRALFPDISPGQALIMLSTQAMPLPLGGLAIAAITAFIITTGDSYLLSAAVNLSWDLYVRYVNPKATEKQKLLITRIVVVLLGIFAYLLIMYFPTVLAVQMYAYTMYGASITPALLAALIWKRATPAGGIASMLTGAIVTIIWEVLKKPYGIGSVLVAAPLAIIVLIIVSYATYKGE
ncbi:MAG: sodium:solute symporter family protein [Euryarchaeota archaeon]|nr:sodium:solute symporter family protein [Euryarchaeota archaeon]